MIWLLITLGKRRCRYSDFQLAGRRMRKINYSIPKYIADQMLQASPEQLEEWRSRPWNNLAANNFRN